MQTINFWQLVSFGEHRWGAMLLSGIAVTIALSVCGFVLSALIGALVAWAKIAGNAPLRIAGDIYTTVLRGIPDLLVIYLFYFGGTACLAPSAVFSTRMVSSPFPAFWPVCWRSASPPAPSIPKSFAALTGPSPPAS